MRYKVFGHTTVTVTTEVNADSSADALIKASEELDSLIAYTGNGGMDKLLGVEGDCDTASADESIEWNDYEELGPDEDDEDDEYEESEDD